MKDFRLTPLVLGVSLSILLVLSAVYTAGNYTLTSDAIKREVERDFAFRGKIAEQAFREKLVTMTEAVNRIVSRYTLPFGNSSARILNSIEGELEALSLEDQGTFLDILTIRNTKGQIISNLSSELVHSSRAIVQKAGQPGRWGIVIHQAGETKLVTALNSIDIIDPEFGRVLGHVVFGVLLNNNLSLTSSMLQFAELDGIELKLRNQTIASHTKELNARDKNNLLARDVMLSIAQSDEPIRATLYMRNAIQSELNAQLTQDLFTLTLVSILVAIVGFLVLRNITEKGILRLVNYAKESAHGNEIEPYQKGRVAEFNTLGETLNGLFLSNRNSELALQQSEARVRNILNSTEEAIYGIDDNGICMFVNRSCLKLLGYQEEDQLIGKNIHALIHFQHADGKPYAQNDCPIFHSYHTGTATHVDNEVFWRADGNAFPVEYWSHPISEHSKIVGAVVTFLDITERKLAEESLRRAQKMDAVGQLTGGIAHDFNNILSIILGNIHLLQANETLPVRDQERLHTIEKSAQRAADLTKQLLAFSRRKSATEEAVNLNRIIAEMHALLERSITPEVQLEQYLAEDLWNTRIDSGDFGDVLLNLIINARDAMPSGGQLIVETSNVELDQLYCAKNPEAQPGEYVQIAVSDTGTGVPSQLLDRIFEPFFTTKPQGKGTGLGLAMVFGFVQRSKGHIKVYSEDQIGTTFRLYLPRTEDQEASLPHHNENATSLPKGHETVLVVDDEADLLALAAESLTSLG